jgi:hypothetical protein
MNPEGPAAPPKKSPIAKRSVNLDGHKTSVSLEKAFWDTLKRWRLVIGSPSICSRILSVKSGGRKIDFRSNFSSARA